MLATLLPGERPKKEAKKSDSGYGYRSFESEAQFAARRGNEKDDAWVSELVNESDGLSANERFKLL